MNYKLIITERAEELLDSLVDYLIFRLENRQAATHLITSIEKIYNRLKQNPFQFPECKDEYLCSKRYRVAVLPDMNYVVVFKTQNNNVFILGVFHDSEKYENKL